MQSSKLVMRRSPGEHHAGAGADPVGALVVAGLRIDRQVVLVLHHPVLESDRFGTWDLGLDVFQKNLPAPLGLRVGRSGQADPSRLNRFLPSLGVQRAAAWSAGA